MLVAVSMFQSTNAAAVTLIQDNGDPGTSSNGTWPVSGGVSPYGSNSRYANANGASYTFHLDLVTPGEYQVFAWWTEYRNRRSSVPIDITHQGGTNTVTVNHRQNGGQWNQLGTTWTFDNQATITIRSLGNGTTSADAIKLVSVGNNTALPAFPIDLRGSIPEEASITLNTSKPANAGDAIITLATYDADFSGEGELIINGNTPVSLFGSGGIAGNDENAADISFRTPASYWRNGNNTLVFRHVNTHGFVIDAATVAFDSAAGGGASSSAPRTGSASLSWTPPVARADGSALAMSEIARYTVRYGTSAGNYPNSVNINGGSSTSATIGNLPVGTYYMTVTTGDTNGRESAPSNMVVKSVQ